jgi:hypothetical protein
VSAPSRHRWSSLSLPCVLALSLVPLAAFASFLSTDRVPIHRDLLVFVLPFKHFLSASLRSGEIPLWNPWIFLGEPFLGSLQAGVFYPPSLLLALPFPLGFNLLLLFHYELALVGMWLFLRDRGLSLPASGVGSLTFSLGGYLVSLLSLTNHLQGAAWAPWFMLVWSRWTSTRSLRGGLWVAIVLALQLLAGSPEHLIMTVVAGASVTWLERARTWRGLCRHGVMLSGAAALTAAFTAFQILPTLEYLVRSTRSQSIPAQQLFHWSLEPVSLLSLLFPNATWRGDDPLIQSLYLGLVPLCLAIAGLSRRACWPWAMTVTAGFVLALGNHSVVLPFLHHLLPALFAKLRYPEKFYFLVHLGMAVLAAEGVDLVLRADVAARRIAVLATAVCAATALTGGWLAESLIALPFAFAPASIRLLAILGVFTALLRLQGSSVIGRGSFCVLLVALVALDLVWPTLNASETASWRELSSRPVVVDADEMRESHQRVFHYGETRRASDRQHSNDPGLALRSTGGGSEADGQLWSALVGDVGMVYGVASVGGAEGFLPKWIESLLGELPHLSREAAVRLLRIFSVRYLIGPDARESPSLDLTNPSGASPYFVYRVREPLPIAYLVSRLREIPDEAAALDAITAPDFALGHEAVVNELPQRWTDASEEPPCASVSILSYGNDSIRLREACGKRALLVLNDAFFPGWEARLDGVPVPIIRTNALVRGVPVDPGEHVVELVYRPRSLRVGIYVSVASLMASALLGWAGGRAPRRFAVDHVAHTEGARP